MIKFDWFDFQKNRIAIHCETETNEIYIFHPDNYDWIEVM